MDEIREVRMHPLDYLLTLRRRIRWFIVPMAACLVLGVLVTFLLPLRFRSAATIAISGGSVSPDLAHPIDRGERMRAFGQQLLAPSTLTKVAMQEHLTPSAPTEADILALRQRIQISLPDPVPGTDPGQMDTYVVSCSDSTAERARRVTQRLAEVFVEDTSKVRQVTLEDTSEFLAARLRETKDELDRVDARLAAQRTKNMGRLPEQTSANVQMLTALRQQLEAATTELRDQQDRLRGIEQQMAMFAQEANELAPKQAATTPQQQRVVQLERELADARMRYTDTYPDVRNLKAELDRAKQEAAAQRPLPPEDQRAVLRQNPAYRALMTDKDQTNLRIRDVERTLAQINGQIRWYEGRLEGAPMIEQQIQSLERDRDLVKKQYDDLSTRLQNAQLSEDVGRRRGSEHFRILYPATLPAAPYEPNRQRLLLMTLGVALVVGVGSAIGREYLDRSIHDARTLQQDFDLPVIGEIPHIQKVA
jgi:polysaccharide chain length determinant protein (PEP-CTERM system associated)